MKKVFLSLTLVVALCIAYAQPRIEFDNKTHDFGTIREEGGKVTARFVFKNTGDSALVLTKVKPGCGCTAADYTRGEVAPGQTGFIDATYDPWGRPNQFNKNIKVFTNEPNQTAPHIIFIKGNVIPRPPTKYELAGYKTGRGEVRFLENSKRFDLTNSQTRIDTFTIKSFYENGRNTPISVELPNHITEVYRSFGKELKAGEEGVIVFKYDPSVRNDWGNLKDKITIITNDTLEPRKFLYFNVNIYEDFSRLSANDLAKAPIVSYDKTLLQLDTIAKNTTSTGVFKITNDGKTPLIIRKIESSLPSLSYQVSKMIIEPKETIELKVSFKSQNRSGKTTCSLDVITNAPNQPKQVLKVESFIR